MSPWHDIDLPPPRRAEYSLPFVCEIPKGRTEKLEVRIDEAHNPIAQDVKAGVLRHLPITPLFNYGMIPQTFERPDHICPISGYPGDGDPADVVEISGEPLEAGSVVNAKLLGSFCFIDGGQADWKFIVSTDISRELDNHTKEILLGFFETYKGQESGNFVYDNRRIFGIQDSIKVILSLHANYNHLKELNTSRGRNVNQKNQKPQFWFPGTDGI
jgi:inorganic pyrophosphatase